MKKIAFIGLGNMGGPMAANLVRKGYEVKGFDLSTDALNHLKNTGGHVADSSIEAIKDVEVVIKIGRAHV